MKTSGKLIAKGFYPLAPEELGKIRCYTCEYHNSDDMTTARHVKVTEFTHTTLRVYFCDKHLVTAMAAEPKESFK